ncbi:MAG: hypothetical protein AAF560_14465 [Acidobacteriota bacterium]
MKRSETTSSKSLTSNQLATDHKSGSLVTPDKIKLPAVRSSDDQPYLDEESDYTRQKQELELSEIQSDLEHRKTYSKRIFILVAIWMFAIFGLIVADGLAWINISDGVLISLIGGTTLNVIGLFAIVARYFFPNR